jgi:signal transduction histidine kinase
MFNLVGNALKFTSSGAVRIRVRQESEELLRVAVEDTGPGIPETSLKRVFEEFEQVREGGRPADKGTGLGLAITKRLVEMHGGIIDAANRPSGGAVFTFTIPVIRSQEV